MLGLLPSRASSAARGAALHCGVQASHHSDSSCCGAPALGALSFVVEVFRGMWDLPGPGTEPGAPALASGFLSGRPPGEVPKVMM